MPYAQYTIKGNDNIRNLSHRLLGDFTKWRELVAINELDPPFIVPDKAAFLARGLRVLEPSDVLFYPRGEQRQQDQQTRLHPYGRDVNMNPDGYLVFQGGTLALTSGIANLSQALTRRLNTRLGNLPAHPDTYGHVMYSYIGRVANQAILETILLEARRATTADSRVASVQATATTSSDTGLVTLTAYATTQEQSVGVLEVTQTVRV